MEVPRKRSVSDEGVAARKKMKKSKKLGKSIGKALKKSVDGCLSLKELRKQFGETLDKTEWKLALVQVNHVFSFVLECGIDINILFCLFFHEKTCFEQLEIHDIH